MTTTFSALHQDIKEIEERLGITITGYEYYSKYAELSNKVIYLFSDSFADENFDKNQLDDFRNKYYKNYKILFMYACYAD